MISSSVGKESTTKGVFESRAILTSKSFPRRRGSRRGSQFQKCLFCTYLYCNKIKGVEQISTAVYEFAVLEQQFSNCSVHQNPLEGCSDRGCWTQPRVSDSVCLGQALIICSYNKFPGDAHAVNQRTTLIMSGLELWSVIHNSLEQILHYSVLNKIIIEMKTLVKV